MPAPARVVAQGARHRNAGQGLAADRSGAQQLPARLRARDVEIDETSLRQPVAVVTAVVLTLQMDADLCCGAAPEREYVVRDPTIERFRDIEAVIAVVLVILDKR